MEETISRRPKAGARVNPGGRRVMLAEKSREHIDIVEVSGSDGFSFTMPSTGGEHGSKTEESRGKLGYGMSVITSHRMSSVGEGG